MDVDMFTANYIEAALADIADSEEWTSAEPPIWEDLDALAYARMANDCKAFQYAASEYFEGREDEAGTDFWLTRNGHGAGFWDGDWPKIVGEILTLASKACGEFDLTVGDDGKIYC